MWNINISPTFFTKAAFISLWAFTCHSLHMLYAGSIVLADVVQTWFKDYKVYEAENCNFAWELVLFYPHY